MRSQTLEQRVDSLFSRMISYEQDRIKMHNEINTEAVKKLLHEILNIEYTELQQLVTHTARLLRFLVDKGIILQSELDTAIGS